MPQRWEKTLCRTELLSRIILTRSQCHTAAAEGAKLSTIRRTPAGGAGRDGIQVSTLQNLHSQVGPASAADPSKLEPKMHAFSGFSFSTIFFRPTLLNQPKWAPKGSPFEGQNLPKLGQKAYPESSTKKSSQKWAKRMQKLKPGTLKTKRFAREGLHFYSFAASAKTLAKLLQNGLQNYSKILPYWCWRPPKSDARNKYQNHYQPNVPISAFCAN